MSLRSDIADALRDNMPTGKYVVQATVRKPDNISKPLVMVNRKELTPDREKHARLGHELEVHVLVPETFGLEAEDAADAALDAVLRVVERIEQDVLWTRAERANFEGDFIGWTVTLTTETANYLAPKK